MIYTYTNLKDQIFDPIRYKSIASSLTVLNVINRTVRGVLSDLDLRTTKRRYATPVGLFDDLFEYPAPTDLKRNAVIDLAPQANRSSSLAWSLVSPEEFDRRKLTEDQLITVLTRDGLRTVRVSLDVDSDEFTVPPLDNLTSGGGTWTAFGDGTNLIADTDVFVKGSGSIRWDISAAGGTTAGIANSGLDTFDISDAVDLNRSVFVWVYLSNAALITNFKLRPGSGASAYYEMTATVAADGTAFSVGWNLIRFDFSGKTTTGSPDAENCTYVALYMTKDGAKISQTGFRFDQIIIAGGVYHDLFYYSKYGWQTSAGVWIENSTTSTDYLNADADEFDIFVKRGKIEAAGELKDYYVDAKLRQEYNDMVKAYKLANPSEALVETQERYRFMNI
jgi:hypothetical protein